MDHAPWGPANVNTLPSLTRLPLKAELYQRETYFREGFSDAVESFGPAVGELLHRSALLMVKPDGLVAAKLRTVVEYLGEHDFEIVAAQPMSFTPHSWRELWRYQLTSATLDRLKVNEHVLSRPALLLLLRSGEGHEVPGTVRLSGLKGSATLSAQRPGTLRSLLGQPNRVLSFIHVADEPADLVRELGLLCDRATRLRLLTALAEGRLSAEGRAVLDEELRRCDEGGLDLSPEPAVERVARAVRECPQADDPAAGWLLEQLAAMSRGERVAWRPFVRELERLDLELDHWDLAVLGTHFITYDEPGWAKVLENPPPGAWSTPMAGSDHRS